MKKTVTLEVEVEYNGNFDGVKEALRKSVMNANLIHASVHKGESFNYKVSNVDLKKLNTKPTEIISAEQEAELDKRGIKISKDGKPRLQINLRDYNVTEKAN